MQLKITRSQKTSGMMSKSVVFCLDARTELTEQEKSSVYKYKLGSLVLYNSEKSRKHLDSAHDHLHDGSALGSLRGAVSVAMAKLSLNITVDSLTKGQHIECKDLQELLGAEEAVMEGCKNLKVYLDTAASFDGREQVIDF